MTLPAPYWQSDCGRYTLYCGDSLAVLPSIETADCVITDPPYGHNNNNGDLIHRWAVQSPTTARRPMSFSALPSPR